jgi:DNA polymerase-4
MDAFFASVEIRRRPELGDSPVIVGGTGTRGVVSAANYLARRFGVHSAMPITKARRLCPQAVFLPPDFDAYTEASRAVMAVFREVTPVVEPLSLDEAFLDVTGCRRRLGAPAEIARLIRRRIADELCLTASVGVAANKFVAKLASTRAKPDGLAVVPAALVLDFLHPLPVSALWGVGDRTADILRGLGLRTVRDIAYIPVTTLRHALGTAVGEHVAELAWGRDPRRVNPESVDKSIGAETTFDVDVADLAVVRHAMLGLSGKVGARLRRAGLVGRTIVIKVRSADFRTVTRSRTLSSPTDVSTEILGTAWNLYRALRPSDRIRLVGVRAENLLPAARVSLQPELGARDQGWREADQAADAARAKYGPGAVRPASLMKDPPLHPGSGRPGAPDEQVR